MPRAAAHIVDFPPRAQAILGTLSLQLSGFGRTSADSPLVLIRPLAGDVMPELHLAMFLRDEADAGEIRASRAIGEAGLAAAAAELSAEFDLDARPAIAPYGMVVEAGLAVLVAADNPSTLIQAAAEAGLTATLVGRSPHGSRQFTRNGTGRRPPRLVIAAWPHRNGPSHPPS